MSGVVVRSAAAGRVRLVVPWLRARPGCAGLVDERLADVRGFRALRIFPRTGSVVIWVRPDLLDVDRLVDALRQAHPPSVPARASRSTPDSSTGEVARLVVGGAVLALVALRRLLGRRPWNAGGPTGALGAVTVFTGLPFFRGALRSLTGHSHPGTDMLVTAATAISLLLRENVVALTVLWLLNIGEFLQTLTLRRTRRAIEELLTIGEERVWLVRDGVEIETALDDVEPGDVVAVYEHHRIPVDGTVVSGEAPVDQAAITGEALPVYARQGAEVYAGTIVTTGSLTVRATSVGRDTTVGRIISRVEEAQADRAVGPSPRRCRVPARFSRSRRPGGARRMTSAGCRSQACRCRLRDGALASLLRDAGGSTENLSPDRVHGCQHRLTEPWHIPEARLKLSVTDYPYVIP